MSKLTAAQWKALRNISSAPVSVLRRLETKGLVTIKMHTYPDGEEKGISAMLTDRGLAMRGDVV